MLRQAGSAVDAHREGGASRHSRSPPSSISSVHSDPQPVVTRTATAACMRTGTTASRGHYIATEYCRVVLHPAEPPEKSATVVTRDRLCVCITPSHYMILLQSSARGSVLWHRAHRMRSLWSGMRAAASVRSHREVATELETPPRQRDRQGRTSPHATVVKLPSQLINVVMSSVLIVLTVPATVQ